MWWKFSQQASPYEVSVSKIKKNKPISKPFLTPTADVANAKIYPQMRHSKSDKMVCKYEPALMHIPQKRHGSRKCDHCICGNFLAITTPSLAEHLPNTTQHTNVALHLCTQHRKCDIAWAPLLFSEMRPCICASYIANVITTPQKIATYMQSVQTQSETNWSSGPDPLIPKSLYT